MHIVLDEAYREVAQARLQGHELTFFPPNFADNGAFSELIRTADVLAFRRKLPFSLTRDVLSGAKNLKYIHKSGSGLDWFDLDLLSELGILLAVNTGVNAISVAEHALTLTLMVSRRTLDYVDIMRSGGWASSLPGNPPCMVTRKKVGLVGTGGIGGPYARMMMAMDAEVFAYHPNPNKSLPEGITRMGLDEMLASVDILALHAPLTEDTHHMIGARELGLMKPSAILINTSRGALVDETALIKALKDNKLRGAGLDVYEHSVLAADSALRALPNVVLTPHIAGAVAEIMAMQVSATVESLERFAGGMSPINLANPEIIQQGRVRAAHIKQPA